MTAAAPAIGTPYPGLRAFETNEGYLFYGREPSWYRLAVEQKEVSQQLAATVASQALALERSNQATRELELTRGKAAELELKLAASSGSDRDQLKKDLQSIQKKSDQLLRERTASEQRANEQARAAENLRKNADFSENAYTDALKKIDQLQQQLNATQAMQQNVDPESNTTGDVGANKPSNGKTSYPVRVK